MAGLLGSLAAIVVMGVLRLAYFNDIRSGQEIVIAWVPGAGLETKVAGADKPVINDKGFASSVFGIWLGDKPVQDDLKQALVSRAPELLK